MSSASSGLTRVARHPDEARVSRRAALLLVALLIAALTGIGLVLAHSTRVQKQSRVTAHLGVALQAALSEASHEAAAAQQRAAALAAEPALQRALAERDKQTLQRLTHSVVGAVAVPGTKAVPPPRRPSLRRAVRVLEKGKVVGTVAVTVPLDGALLSQLRLAAPLAAGEGILFIRGDQILARPAGIPEARVPPGAQTVRLGGTDYLVVQLPIPSPWQRSQA